MSFPPASSIPATSSSSFTSLRAEIHSLLPPAAPRLHTVPLPSLASPYPDHLTVFVAREVDGTTRETGNPFSAVDLLWMIDSIVAFSPASGAFPQPGWNLARDPGIAIGPTSSLRRRPAVLARTSAIVSALPMLTLVFPHLPVVQVVIHPAYPHTFVSTADVLAALYSAFREPVDPSVLATLGRNDRARLYWNARMRGAAEGNCEAEVGMVRKIDFLGAETRFLGLRPAASFEVPLGTCLGEVFIVEMGSIRE